MPPAGTLRADLRAYFATYAEEARDRGFPLIRPMPMQFSKDPQAARYIDQFMLGDELLVAPLLAPGNRRSVYLPMGIWTNLKTNQTHPGRQVIPIEAEAGELPLFSRNGALFPLGSNPTVLHYFPRLGGEFFLFESDIAEYSQVHAGPAGDLMRLEIESKKDREYEWLVHHTAAPRKVTAGDETYAQAPAASELRAGTWRHDATRNNVHVRAKVKAGDDNIINLLF